MTPKEALEVLVSNLDQRALRSLSSSDSYWTVFEEVTESIKTLEKVTELLGLYKEINNKRKELITLARHNTWSWELDIETKDVQDKIEALEKELGGMK